MPEPVFRGPGVGKQIISRQEALAGRAPGAGRIVKVGEAETLGAYSVFESVMAPGAPGPLPHIHNVAEEAWYVIEGTLKFRIGEEEIIGDAGSFVLVPRGSLHSYSNASDRPARYLMIFSPPRDVLWDTVTEMREEAGDAPLDMEKVQALYAQYGENPPAERSV